MSIFNAFLKDESGAAAAEYVLILAIIGGAIATAATLLGGAVKLGLDNATTVVNTAAGKIV